MDKIINEICLHNINNNRFYRMTMFESRKWIASYGEIDSNKISQRIYIDVTKWSERYKEKLLKGYMPIETDNLNYTTEYDLDKLNDIIERFDTLLSVMNTSMNMKNINRVKKIYKLFLKTRYINIKDIIYLNIMWKFYKNS